MLGLKKAHAQAGGTQDSSRQGQRTSAGPCLPNPWPPLQQTQPVGAVQAKWCGGFLMRLSRERMNQTHFFLWPKQDKVMNSDLQRREAYVLSSCRFTALLTKPRNVAMHRALLKLMPGVPLKMAFHSGQ